jgi:aminoglycoside phosphotransferase (APT) family kinase protein
MADRAGRNYGSLGTITDAQLQSALHRFDLGRLTSAWPLTDGLFGKNVAVDCSSGSWVLRGSPWPPDSDEQFRREAYFARVIADACPIRAPWPYHVERDPSLFGWSYALMPRIDHDGIDLSDTGLDWTEVAAGLGRGLAGLHRLAFPGAGEWSADIDDLQPFDGSPATWLEARVAAWLFRIADTSQPLDDASTSLVLDHLAAARAELTPALDVTYVHHDYKANNAALAARPNGRVEVIGVYDLNEGYAGDPLEDLPRALAPLARGHSPEAGAESLTTYQQTAGRLLSSARIVAYTVFDLLVLWEFGRRPSQNWFPPDATFATWSRPSIEAVRRAVDLVPS